MRKSQRAKLKISEEEKIFLIGNSKSKTLPYREVLRSKILLKYHENKTITAIAKECQTNRPLVERCIDKALSYGIKAAMKDMPGRGVDPTITDDSKNWVLSIACQSPKSLGFANELWTYSLLIKYIKANCIEQKHECLINIGKSVLNGILSKENIKPHKISYYLEKRDPEFEIKMANILQVYEEISIINEQKLEIHGTTISYDEKPGIQAIKNIAPQLQPIIGKYTNVQRDYEIKDLGH